MNKISSNSMALKEAQELILEFARDYFDEKIVANIEKTIRECPVHFANSKEIDYNANATNDGILDKSHVGGYASDEGIFIPSSAASYDKNVEFDRDITIGLIIHEYAHRLRKINSDYGNMFEEGFATVFAESCIIHSEIKKQKANGKKIEQPSVYNNTGWKYQKAESQIRAILYILNEHDIDMQLIGEYIFGNQNIFIQKCTEIFGKKFIEYFNLANSRNDQYYNDYENEQQNSEIMLVNLIANYIKNNGINLSNYYNRNHIFEYNGTTETLAKGIVSAGPNYIKPEDTKFYRTFEYTVEMSNKESNLVIEDRINRIKKTISEKYNLNGKSKEEIYETIEDLCSEYIQRKDSARKENKIFINEIKKLVPSIEKFIDNFIILKKSKETTAFLNDLDKTNMTYLNISKNISNKVEEFKENIKLSFNGCNTKEKLLNNIKKIEKNKDLLNIDQLLPNYNDFINFIKELDNKIPESFNENVMWNYESLYNEILKLYITNKEYQIEQSKTEKEEYLNTIKVINKQYNVINNEKTFIDINNKNNNLNNDIDEAQIKLEEENKNRNNNELEKNNLLKRQEELQKKNLLIRLFKRNEIKKLQEKISIIKNNINNNDNNLENYRNSISNIRKQISDNEKQLIDLCGLKIEEYSSILKQVKSENITAEHLTEKSNKINEALKSTNIDIAKLEQELSEICKKNGIIKENLIEQTQAEAIKR